LLSGPSYSGILPHLDGTKIARKLFFEGSANPVGDDHDVVDAGPYEITDDI
jgi:hypothetical protein